MDKDEGPTSFGVVRRVRNLLGGVRSGHVGSLDPFATGLLPVCVGRATRLARFIESGSKRYRARIAFGRATDTDDRTGRPLGAPAAPPPESELRLALAGFVGEIEQRPPRYSAKHIGGRRAYRLARAGKPVTLAPVRVRVESLALLGYDGRSAEIECRTGPGTYIRAIARDLGQRLGGAAHLDALRRTAVGPFRVEEAARLEALPDRAAVVSRLLDPLAALAGTPRLVVSKAEAAALGHGRAVPFRAGEGVRTRRAREAAGIRCAVTAPVGDGEARAENGGDRRTGPGSGGGAPRLVAVVSATDAGWRPIVVWTPAPRASAPLGGLSL